MGRVLEERGKGNVGHNHSFKMRYSDLLKTLSAEAFKLELKNWRKYILIVFLLSYKKNVLRLSK